MNNIISLCAKREEATKKPTENDNGLSPEVKEFLEMFYDWSLNNGLDVDAIDWKYDSASIIAVIQGMLHKMKGKA